MAQDSKTISVKQRAGAWLATLAGVFASGAVLGFGLGVWVADPVARPVSAVAVPERLYDYQPTDAEEGLPVTVFRSESALKQYTYEEPVAPPVPSDAPLAAVVATPPPPEPPRQPVAEPTGGEQAVAAAPAKTAPAARETAKAPQAPQLARLPEQAERPEPQRDGAPAWMRNAVPVRLDLGRPMIAVIIDDLGIDQKRSRAAIALPGPLTLAFIPYGYNLRQLVGSARSNRHEVMLHLPMEPLNPDIDPGPNALLVDLDPAERARRLEWALGRFNGYVGINNHMGSRFTAWSDGMRPVLDSLRERGLLYVDSITTQDTVGYRMARSMGVPNVTRDVFLDHDQRPEAIAKALARTEKIARNRGIAVAIGHPHDATIAELARWIPLLAERGIQLVPVSAIVRATNPSG